MWRSEDNLWCIPHEHCQLYVETGLPTGLKSLSKLGWRVIELQQSTCLCHLSTHCHPQCFHMVQGMELRPEYQLCHLPKPHLCVFGVLLYVLIIWILCLFLHDHALGSIVSRIIYLCF